MVVIGIDQSLTASGVVILHDGDLVYHCVIKSCKADGDNFQRVENISTAIMLIVNKYKPDYAVIEGLAMGARAGMLGDLGGLQHVILSKIKYGYKCPMDVIPPKTLKKLATGTGNADKWMMFDALHYIVRETFVANYKFSKRENKGISGTGFDATDAFHLANTKTKS